ncbi:2,3-bisphosphoglycerate-independent phosphoglycerate mutase [Kipferlia bialata]|uniref:2,3-bisphosphoglycerate-independent phosphoglycerate mutase n=1 Tax=Kipferlia bialata TaxID=797122 RepID=A0A9K3D1F3_9EUKA|nr:2,3-bisphosphoglycerate-independent phosphoglycerate mutase [Kipferlia bialata]|eukprot:g7217.t1
MRVLLVVLDGLGDCPHASLGGMTPLEAAHTPTLDSLARDGMCGVLDPVGVGVAPQSDSAHLAMLGYATQDHPGRGVLEALGVTGRDIPEGSLAFKCVFAHTDPSTALVHRRPLTEEGVSLPSRVGKPRERGKWDKKASSLACQDLCRVLNEATLTRDTRYSVKFTYDRDHRCVCVVENVLGEPGTLSSDISGTDPLYDGLPCLECTPTRTLSRHGVEDPTERAEHDTRLRTATLINDIHRRVQLQLAHSQYAPYINTVLFRAPSSPIKVDPFHVRNGYRLTAVCDTPVIAGVCRHIGVSTVVSQSHCWGSSACSLSTGLQHLVTPHTSPSPSSPASPSPSPSFPTPDQDPAVFVHIKDTDTVSHKQHVHGKKETLERIDTELSAALAVLSDPTWTDPGTPTAVIVTGDHSTPCAFGDHSNDTVPFLLSVVYGREREEGAAPSVPHPDLTPDSVSAFSEAACVSGCLGRVSGAQMQKLMGRLVNVY